MKLLILIYLCHVVIAFSFQPKKPITIWSSPISTGELTEGLMYKFLYKNGVICHGQNRDTTILLIKNIQNGKTLWTWYDKNVKLFYPVIGNVFLKKNVMIINNGNHNYSINLENGQLAWAKKINSSSGLVSSIDKYYFFRTQDPSSISWGTSPSGKERIVYRIPSISGYENLAEAPGIFRQKGNIMLVIGYAQYNPKKYTGYSEYALYNFSQNKLVYTQRIRPEKPNCGIYGVPIIYKSKIYCVAGNGIYCHDVASGKQVWQKEFLGGFISTGVTLIDGKIIGNCEDGMMYATDPETGKEVWRTKTTGTCSSLFYMDGTIYFTGGGDGLLYAVDAKTGMVHWKVHAPSEAQNSNDFFFGNVTGANGKIYVSSYTTLYCFNVSK